MPATPAALALDTAGLGTLFRIVDVVAPSGQPDWEGRLGEIGFVPGEHVAVKARGAWGADPLVVRVGDSTFALRRAEAACVRVEPCTCVPPRPAG